MFPNIHCAEGGCRSGFNTHETVKTRFWHWSFSVRESFEPCKFPPPRSNVVSGKLCSRNRRLCALRPVYNYERVLRKMQFQRERVVPHSTCCIFAKYTSSFKYFCKIHFCLQILSKFEPGSCHCVSLHVVSSAYFTIQDPPVPVAGLCSGLYEHIRDGACPRLRETPVQGYLAHEKHPPPLRSPSVPRHRNAVGSYGGGLISEVPL